MGKGTIDIVIKHLESIRDGQIDLGSDWSVAEHHCIIDTRVSQGFFVEDSDVCRILRAVADGGRKDDDH